MAKAAAAGALPPLVALLGPQSTAAVQEAAVEPPCVLSVNNDNTGKAKIAGAALPPLVDL